jgi:ribosomal protein S18 acetylase RimI-like enzyme
MDFTVRQAGAADCNWLWATKTRCLRAYIEQTYGAWDEDTQQARFDAGFIPEEIRIFAIGGRDAAFTAVRYDADVIQLFNLMVAPEFQNRGLGTVILRQLLTDAQARNLPVRLQVMKVNPARQLYARVGFREIPAEEIPTHYRMIWRPV